MNDRELLEWAAKAAGIQYKWADEGGCCIGTEGNQWTGGPKMWNPLTDDGEEARLEAALGLNVEWFETWVYVGKHVQYFTTYGGDKQKTRRYAGVIAAAIIGKAKK
jgi:hypothetical protein